MPDCDVCLRECRDDGVLSCGHVVCQGCCMSQNKCMICARDVSKTRTRLGKRPASSISPTTWTHVDGSNNTFTDNGDIPHGSSQTHAAPTRTISPAPISHSVAPLPEYTNAGNKSNHTKTGISAVHKDKFSSGDGDDCDNLNNMLSNGVTADLEPPPKKLARVSTSDFNHTNASNTATIMTTTNSSPGPTEQPVMVHAPTAFDEVRCELRAEPSTPKVSRSALRTSGKLSVDVLRKFLHAQLDLSPDYAIIIRCAGEDLVDAMTLGQIDTHIWPKSSGHLVLDYRIVRTA